MNSDSTTTSDNQTVNQLAMKAYRSPELVIYGNISEITMTADMNGATDGGGGMMNKT